MAALAAVVVGLVPAQQQAMAVSVVGVVAVGPIPAAVFKHQARVGLEAEAALHR